MCGRYALFCEENNARMNGFIEICNQCAEADERIEPKDSDDVKPGDMVPGLISDSRGVRAAAMRWGFSGLNGGLVINARSEDAAERIMFMNLLENSRCALPAARYFEWRRGDGQKYQVSSTEGESLYLLGLYRTDEAGKRVCVILTREAYGIHAKIHSRMPVAVRSRCDARNWLNGKISLAEIIADTDDGLSVEALGAEQLQIDFDDHISDE